MAPAGVTQSSAHYSASGLRFGHSCQQEGPVMQMFCEKKQNGTRNGLLYMQLTPAWGPLSSIINYYYNKTFS